MIFATLLASLLYLVPVAVLVFARTKSPKGALDVALAIPTAVALDLLTLLLLARVVSFERAVLLSRPLWVIGWFVHSRRARGGHWVPDLPRKAVVAALLAAFFGFVLSAWLSRPYGIWDRAWHVPLVASLRTQTVPFANVFEPGTPLYYHSVGDALAAALQTMSLAAIHSSLALSLAHDLMFALTGATMALLLVNAGHRAIVPPVVLAMTVLLNGPFSALKSEVGQVDSGYSLFAYVSLSFRPHVCIAGLMCTGVLGGLFARLDHPTIPTLRTLPSLFACMALLAISDESSFPILGLGLGTAWFFMAGAVHPKRLVGLGILLGVAALLPLANIVYSSALAPGGPVAKLALAEVRNPGYFGNPPLLLAHHLGLSTLFRDTGSALVAVALLAVLRLWKRTPGALATLAGFGAIVASSLFLFAKVEVNGNHAESHRFFTLALLSAPVVMTMRLGHFRTGSLARIVALGALGLSAASSLLWIERVAPGIAHKPYEPLSHEMNCRSEFGARLFDAPRWTYAEPSVLWAVTGCRPTYIPGVRNIWPIKTDGPVQGVEAFRELDQMAGNASLRLFCPATGSTDAFCNLALARKACASAGTRGLVCMLGASERAELLRSK